MKKAILMILVMAICSFAVFAQAEERMVIAPEPMPPVDNAFGQDHYYSVVFDEEGDATVAAKLKVQNTGKENLTSMQIEIPGKAVRVVNMFQEFQKEERVCSYWEKVCTDYDEETDTCSNFKDKCNNWYWQKQWPPFYYTIDRTAEQLSKSVKYDLKLPVPIKEQETGIVIIYYKVEGYVDKSLGVYDFDFETIKLNQDINEERVVVNVQEGLYLKGGEAKVDYRSSFAAVEKTAPMAEGVQSQDLQAFSSQIEYQSGFVKTAQGLDPWESFHVKGEYATSWLMLHKIAVLLGVLFAVVVIGGIAVGFKRLVTSKKESFIVMFGIGSGAAILMILNWVLFSYLVKNLPSWVGWQYSSLLGLLLILLAAIITLAFLVGPPLYVGLTSNAKNGFIVLGIEIVMLVLLSIILVILLAVIGNAQPPIVYGAMEAMAVD